MAALTKGNGRWIASWAVLLRKLTHSSMAILSSLCLCWAATSLQVGQNFTGSRAGVDSSADPSDANGAVGPSHFVEFINGRFSVYDKKTAARVQTLTDITFWTRAGVTFSTGLAVTDPRLLYDRDAHRWFASMIDFLPSAQRKTSNRFLFAVSTSADPTSAWRGFAFTADPVSGNFADFPTLGLDSAAVYLAGDMYTARLGLHIGSSLVVLPKPDLLANAPSIERRSYFGGLAFNAHGQVLQPAVVRGEATSLPALLAVGNLGLDGRAHSTLVETILENGTLTNSAAMLVPDYSLPDELTQPNASGTLDGGDTRLSASVQRVGDMLYAVHSTKFEGKTAVRWYRIAVADRVLLESGTVVDPNLDLFFPSIAANEFGTVVIACNGVGASSFVSCYATVGISENGSLRFGELVLLKSGLASYRVPDSSGMSRWGDYSATTVDPADATRFWTVQTYASSSRGWATQVTELITAPVLVAIVVDGTVRLSWSSSSSEGSQLQKTDQLGPHANWAAVTQKPVVTDGRAELNLTGVDAQGFFRLVR